MKKKKKENQNRKYLGMEACSVVPGIPQVEARGLLEPKSIYLFTYYFSICVSICCRYIGS